MELSTPRPQLQYKTRVNMGSAMYLHHDIRMGVSCFAYNTFNVPQECGTCSEVVVWRFESRTLVLYWFVGCQTHVGMP